MGTNITKGLGIAAVATALAVVPAHAQTGSGSLGLFGSFMRGGELAELEVADEDVTELRLDDGFAGGASLEFWLGDARRWGFRADGSYADTGFDPVFEFAGTNDVNVWMGDANLMFRPWAAQQDRWFLPFLSLGAGAMHWDVSDDLVGDIDPVDARISGDETEFAVTGSAGADIFLTNSVSLRLEAKDYFNGESPYESTVAGDNFDGGHNWQFRAGLNLFWGGRDEVVEPGFIREEPEVEETEPIVEVEPEPEPEPEPVTETVTRCVVGEDNHLTTVTATRYVETDRVVVERNGREVEFETAYPATGPRYVRGASWYVNDQPLSVRVGEEADRPEEEFTRDEDDVEVTRLEFVRFGTASNMSADRLEYAGTVNGTPIYLEQGTLDATTSTRLRNALQTQDDLETVLRDDAELAREFGEVETAYVAVEPGCVFQPISLTSYVRSTRG